FEALVSGSGITPRGTLDVILGGHDRGARICHRLAVSQSTLLQPAALHVIGAILMDIVPTKVQWDHVSNPAVAQSYFHWPLLANVDVAVKMLRAYGGARWVRDMHFRIGGNSEEGLRRLTADDAVDGVYAPLFEKEEALWSSCEDHAADAKPECDEQMEDQKLGREIEAWRDWIAPGVAYTSVPIGEGYGHYLPEEAPTHVAENILAFLKQYA
ncbi:hypothetical protein QBC46DRAFT_416353, partial [Diplogelasinospora grovesii]